MMEPRRFPIRLGRRSRPLLRLLGVREGNAYVELGDEDLVARFGAFGLRTSMANVERWRIEGPWLWITAIGVRTGIRRDVTFGGNHQGGVRLDFRDPVPFLFYRASALYVTVGDLEGLAAALTERGVPGLDAREPRRP